MYGRSIPVPRRLPEGELSNQTQNRTIQPVAHKRRLEESQEQDNGINFAIDPELQNPSPPSVFTDALLAAASSLGTGLVPVHAPSPTRTVPTSPASVFSPALSVPTSPIIPPVDITPEPTTTSTQPDRFQPSATITAAQSDTASNKRQKGNGGKASAKKTKVDLPKRTTRATARNALGTATNTHRDGAAKRRT